MSADGTADLAVGNEAGTNVSIFRNTGSGVFDPATNFGSGVTPLSVAIGDVNSDGIPDLAVGAEYGSSISLLLGTGAGSFGPANAVAVGNPFGLPVAIGDLNGDGIPDLAVGNYYESKVSILLGTGTGSFGSATTFAVGAGTQPGPISVVIGDLNGDGILDLVTANPNTNTLSILSGTGTGSFGAATNLTVGLNPFDVAIGDLNGDGRPDLAVANVGSNNVSILLNTTVFHHDTTPPTITETISGPQYVSGPNTFVTSASVLTVNVSDADSGVASCSITLDGVPQLCAAGDNAIGLVGPDGPYTVVVDAIDNDGNVADTLTQTVILDNTAPALSPVVSPNPVLQGASASASPNASDGSGSGLATASCAAPSTSSLGPQTVSCSATDNLGHSASATPSYLVYATAPGGGSFVIGNQSTAGTVTFWGAQWSKLNSLSGGAAPSSFKGFAKNAAAPVCGANWSTDPGNSASPPPGPLPAYMAVIVTSSSSKSGSLISGSTVHVVVVRTNAGYDANPGHAGTGTVVATIC